MADLNLAMIAQETIKITEQGYYLYDGKKVSLNNNDSKYSFEDVIVFDEDKLMFISEDEDQYFRKNFKYSKGAQLFLHNCDSYEMAKEIEKPLVMNFANAIHPGGGFLKGARAQEEALCRCSTLYKSISSNKAFEMYHYNRRNSSPVDSDYMLLSPNVSVFRNKELELLPEPFNVSVITIPAPNKNGRARNVQQDILDKVMMNRIRKMFWAAARYGYRNLVLGAWGCGAFGHDTATVASYFYKILIDEKYNMLFDTVAFAILNDERKIDAFASVFGTFIEDLSKVKFEDTGVVEPICFMESAMDFPVCNHTVGVGKENLGYTQGIIAGGIPFEAELWEMNDTLNLSIIMPEIIKFDSVKEEHLKDGNMIGFHEYMQGIDGGALLIGMVDHGMIDDVNVLIEYNDFLKDNQIIEFCGEMENGALLLVTDINGNDFVNLIIMLEEKGKVLAKTSLSFRPFPNQKKGHHLKVVK